MALMRLLPRPNTRARTDNGPTLAKIIVFANQKGGVAKTTTTLNLGVALFEKGLKVLAIDLDPQGNLTMSQGIDPDTLHESMYDVLAHRMPIRQVIRKREIDIACASIDLAGAEIAMSTMIGRERALQTHGARQRLPVRSRHRRSGRRPAPRRHVRSNRESVNAWEFSLLEKAWFGGSMSRGVRYSSSPASIL